jgi:hypothetical protein
MDSFKSVNYKLKFETEIETSVRYYKCKSVVPHSTVLFTLLKNLLYVM